MTKDFDRWNRTKQKLDILERKNIPPFYEREIWWCSIGLNIGFEIYGKGRDESFSRPVLVLKKHNKFTFYGLPLGSTIKSHSLYHFPITTNGRKGSVLLSQGRTFSGNRLLNRMVKITDPEFDAIRKAYRALY